MYRYALIILIGLGTAGQAAASWADSLFEELSHDFGSVPHGPTLTHHFRFTNKTQGPVTIASVRVSCGCVHASALQAQLAPGQTTSILAQMDSSRFHGAKSVTIYVQFQQPEWEEVRLVVQANSREDMLISPDTLAFGKMQRGTSPSVTVTVAFYGNGQMRVEEARSESNYVRPAIREVRRDTGEVAYELTASLRSDIPVGKWFTDLWLRTDNPTVPLVRVPLTVEVEPALSVNPRVAFLGEVKNGASTERKVIVKGSRPFRITDIKGGDELLRVSDSTHESKQVHVLTLALKADKVGDFNWKLRILTDLNEENEVDFPAQARVVP
jgi:hypothetical protein